MIRTMALLTLVSLLLACGLFARSETQTDGPAEQTAAGAAFARIFHGDTLVEQKILKSDVTVRATMASLSSDVIAEPNGEYSAMLKFTLTVHEYLKGTGPTSVKAVWVDGSSYATRSGAEAAKSAILASRDTQWDNREAVFFLYGGPTTYFGTELASLLQATDHLFIGFGDPQLSDDHYSLHSEWNRKWLPAASSGGGSATSDTTQYLLDVPALSGGTSGRRPAARPRPPSPWPT